MDVVRNNIEQLNGDIEIHSEKGKGTSIKIILPLTLAIIQALMVREKENDYAIPLASVYETVAVDEENKEQLIKTVKSREVVRWRDQVIPLIKMSDFYQLGDVPDEGFVIVVGVKEKTVGIWLRKFSVSRK